jgi:uncharacterized protein
VKCPTCPDVTLVIADRSGIEIDYCPQCRGVWLDRGELDKMIERNAAATTPASTDRPKPRDWDDSRSYGDHRGDPYYGKRKKKSSLLGELFDF